MPKALLLISSSSSTLFIFYIVRCVDCIAKDMLIELSRTIARLAVSGILCPSNVFAVLLNT